MIIIIYACILKNISKELKSGIWICVGTAFLSLSRLNVVQKETMWSLILYVVCSLCMCMYVVICKIDHCIHIHWCIPMGLVLNDPWVESHMWPQQMWGQRSSRGQWPLVQVLAKRFTASTYFDVFSWDLPQWSLGRVTHVTSTDVGSKAI